MLPVVYRLWASLRLGHFREGVEEWLPKSVFSLGNGLSSVDAWFSTALVLRRFFRGLVVTSYMSWSLMSSSLLTLWTGLFWIALWGGWDCLTVFVGRIFLFIVGFGSGLSLLRGLANLGVGTVVFPRVVL